MKKFLIITLGLVTIFLFSPSPVKAQNFKIGGYCEQGGKTVTTQGLISTTKVQQSFPSCSITVFNAGTLTPSTIFSDSSGTPKSNPFIADTNGYWFFYVPTSSLYDVKMSSGGIPSPFTITDLISPGTGGGGGSGTVTSVAITVPAFLNVTGSPITTNGSITIGLSGTALPIANGGTGSTTQNFVDLTTNQTVAGNKNLTGITTFQNIPTADAAMGSTITALLLRGSDTTSGSPSSSNNPSIFLQTFRTGGANGVGQFGTLINYNVTGISAADTYPFYVLNRYAANLTGAPTGDYFQLASRSYIRMSPTNIGSSNVIGYGIWSVGETTTINTSVYGAQLDGNNSTGTDAAFEDFSSRFKVGAITTHNGGNANNSTIIFSQGITNTSYYKGWKINPNAVIRHVLDFSDASYTLPGTIQVTSTSNSIVGTSTKFLSDLVLGDQLQIIGVPYTISLITDDTHATISPVYAAANNLGLTVAKYITPLRMAPNSYITTKFGSLEYRMMGFNSASQLIIDADAHGTVFSGIVQVPSPLQIGGNSSSEIALKRVGTALLLRLGDDSAYTILDALGYRVSGGATLGNVLRGNGTNFVSSQLAAVDLSNGVSGSGAVSLVTQPTFITDITSPALYGGALAGSTITIKGTSNAGPVAAHLFLNSSSTASTMGSVVIGSTSVAGYTTEIYESGVNQIRIGTTGAPGVGSAGITAGLTAMPTAADQRLAFYTFGASTGIATQLNGAVISGFSDGIWTAGVAQGTYIKIETTNTGTASRTEKWRFDGPGNLISVGRTFANLGTPANGSVVFCTDCNATCTAGAGTGRTCFRENGAWTH